VMRQEAGVQQQTGLLLLLCRSGPTLPTIHMCC
jgi:hypothetical protein